MKYLSSINEWKTEDDKKYDQPNIDELNDLFIELIDFGITRFFIRTDQFIEQSYNVSWSYPLNLNIGSKPDKITSDSIKKHKQKLGEFIKIQEETHEILERLLLIGYSIGYYSVYQDDDEFKFEIRITKHEN